MSFMTSDWLDGPGLYRWLTEHGLESLDRQLGGQARAVRHWRDGALAYIYTADAVLCKLGLHLTEIPDELWTDALPAFGKRLPSAAQQEIKRRVVEMGEPANAVAQALGCDPKTVRRYAKAAA